MSSSPDTTGSPTCANCGGKLERVDEYTLDIAGEGVPFYADRCTSCLNEFVNAPDILRTDGDLLSAFRPEASLLGSYRGVMSLSTRDEDFKHVAGPKVAPTILAYLLDEDLADVAFLAHLGVTEEPVVALSRADLSRAGEIRMGSSRAVFTGSGLRTNLLTLTQLRRFAEADRGAHPRIAVMGRPCQIYAVRKLLWDRFLPGYRLAFALGTFCYGNFAPIAWGGRRLRELLGFDPVEIRRVDFAGEELRFTSVTGTEVKIGQDALAGLVNPNCLQCYDFSVSFSDVSVGSLGADDMLDTAILRTDLGERIVQDAIKHGRLMTSSAVYGRQDLSLEDRKAVTFLEAMVEIKKQLTRSLR